jgi:hypothetical protein
MQAQAHGHEARRAVAQDSEPRAAAPTSPPPCLRCGHDADVDFGDLWLCMDCYHVAGSTCAGVARSTVEPAEPVC